jgi:hypothetical protein
MAADPPPDPAPAQSTPRAVCQPGWLMLGNAVGLGGVLLILVVEMAETGRWRSFAVPCLFLAQLLLQLVCFWLAGRGRAVAGPVPHGQQQDAEPS